MSDNLKQYGEKINSQIALDEMNNTYNSLLDVKNDQSIIGLTPFYPTPSPDDYAKGSILRHFFLRYTGDITEVSREEGSKKKGHMPSGIYYYIVINWRIVDSLIAPDGYIDQDVTTANVNEFYIKQGVNHLPSNLQEMFFDHFFNLELFKLQE